MLLHPKVNLIMKNIITLAFIGLLMLPATAQLPGSLKGVADKIAGGGTSSLSNDDVIAGLKEALSKGAEGSVLKGSALDGFWKNDKIRIPFPSEAEKMKGTLNSIGMTKQVEEFEMTMNRAAEEAAKEALPVLKDAVTGMSVGDGFAILKGGDNAATNYLNEKTNSALMERFSSDRGEGHCESRTDQLLDTFGQRLQQSKYVDRRKGRGSGP